MKHISRPMFKEILSHMKEEQKDDLLIKLFVSDDHTKTVMQSIMGVVDKAGAVKDVYDTIDRRIGGGKNNTSFVKTTQVVCMNKIVGKIFGNHV